MSGSKFKIVLVASISFVLLLSIMFPHPSSWSSATQIGWYKLYQERTGRLERECVRPAPEDSCQPTWGVPERHTEPDVCHLDFDP